MEFNENDIRKALSRTAEKLSRQRTALATTEAEYRLWEELLTKKTVKK